MSSTSKKVLFLIVFIDLLGFGVMIPMLPFYARSFNASAFEVGLLMFVYSFIQIFVGPLWGALSDRYGRRPILLATILGQAFAMIWGGFAGSYLTLFLSRGAAGLFAGNISTASAFMADITSKEDRAKGMGLIGAAFGLGFVFGPAVGGFLIEYGPHWPFLFSGALGIINFVWAASVLKEPKRSEQERKSNRKRFDWATIKRTLDLPQVINPILIFLLLTLAFVHLEITFGLFVFDEFGFSERQAGYLLAFMGVIMAIVQGGLIGRLTQRFGEKSLVFSGILFILGGLGGIVMANGVFFLVSALIILAIGYSLTNPCLSAATSKAAPDDQQGSILGVYQSSGSLARVLGPLTAGFLYDQGMRLPYYSALLIVVIGAVIWAKWRFIATNAQHEVV